MLAKLKCEKALDAIAAGVVVVEEGKPSAKLTNLVEAVKEYLDEIKAHRSKKTEAAYSVALRLFLEACPKRNVEEISRKDVLTYIGFLKGQRAAYRRKQGRERKALLQYAWGRVAS